MLSRPYFTRRSQTHLLRRCGTETTSGWQAEILALAKPVPKSLAADASSPAKKKTNGGREADGDGAHDASLQGRMTIR